MERVNEEKVAVKLLNKINESTKRNNLAIYRQILYEEFESKTCFYCRKQLSPDEIDVDHFIPWSFIKDDNLWNLVLACPSCNRKKNDKLPAGDYLAALVYRNQHLLIETHRPEMKNYQERMVRYVYNWAKINGYNKIWQPERRKVLV
ncbi:MAG: HNH endonuclease domain-containing protein [Clostridium sp.]